MWVTNAFFTLKLYGVDTLKNFLSEAFLTGTHNMCLTRKLQKIIPKLVFSPPPLETMISPEMLGNSHFMILALLCVLLVVVIMAELWEIILRALL